MPTLSVTAEPVWGFMARVIVSLTDPDGPTMSLYRIDGTRELPVLGAVDVPAASTVFDDAEVPLNRPVQYRVVTSGGSASTGLITVQSRWCVLSDPYSGLMVPVAIIDQGPVTAAQRGRAVDIEESGEVVYVYDVESADRSPLSLLTLDAEGERVLVMLAQQGGPLLLRAACPVHEVGWFARDGGTRTLKRVTDTTRNTKRIHEFSSIVRVGAPLDERPLGDTLGDLNATVPTTLGDLAAQWSTLGDIAAADLRGA